MMKFAVVVFPGTNCDHDAYHAARDVLGQEAEFVWHKDTDLKGADVVILPGGFAHGDYLRTGAMARFSPIMRAVRAFAERGGPVLGICNGFQILLEAGLLPGAMLRNRGLKFHCEHVHRPRRADRHAVHVRRAGAARCCGFRSRTAKATTSPSPTSSRALEANRQVSSATRTPAGDVDRRRESERVGGTPSPASATRRATSSA